MDIQQLVNDIKKGNKRAQACFFRHYSNRCYYLCLRFMKNSEDAEERMINGFYGFFKTIQNFKYNGDDSVFQRLKRVMINKCIDQLRLKKVFHIVSETEANDVSLDDDVLDKLSEGEIQLLISRLPVGYRLVFNLSVIDGYEHEEIARLLGISPSTSRSQLWKARTLLQKLIKQNELQHGKQQSK